MNTTITKLVTKRCRSNIFAHLSGAIFFLNLCIKFGDPVTLAEANTLRFFAKHTSIPVPKVGHAFAHCGKTYILMGMIRGETMTKGWRLLLEKSKASIFTQLRQIIEELRHMNPETTAVCNLEGGSIHDCRLPKTSSWGPFESVYDFHLARRNNEAQSLHSPSPAARLDMQGLVP